MAKRQKHSIRAIAQQLGLVPSTVYSRIRKGWPLDKALSKPTRRLIDGKTLREWATEFGITYETAAYRHAMGLPFDRQPKITHEGKSLKEWAAELGVSYNTAWNRYKRGLPMKGTDGRNDP